MKKTAIAICLVALVVGGCSASNQKFSESKEICLGEPNEISKGVYLYRGYVGSPENIDYYWISIAENPRFWHLNEFYFATSQGHEHLNQGTSKNEIAFVYEDFDGDGKIDEVYEFIHDFFGTFYSPDFLHWQRNKDNEGYFKEKADTFLYETRAKYLQYIPFEAIEKKHQKATDELATEKLKKEQETDQKIKFPTKKK